MTKTLTEKQKKIMWDKETEKPFSHQYHNNTLQGTYHCAFCYQLLFHSNTKFNSGTGWPSFFDQADPFATKTQIDNSTGNQRIEVLCSQCKGHLGHVFDDGPPPTNKRYCINGASLTFEPHMKDGFLQNDEESDIEGDSGDSI